MYIDRTERAAVGARGDAAEEGPGGVQVCHHETVATLGGGDLGMKGGKEQGSGVCTRDVCVRVCACACDAVRVVLYVCRC